MTKTSRIEQFDAVARRITEGPGTVDPSVRAAVLADRGDPAPLAVYLEKVRHDAVSVTDEDLRALRAAGYTEDALFELTIAAAFGEARRGLGVALDAMRPRRGGA